MSFGALAQGGEEAGDWHRLVGILQYLQADYPSAVASGEELELEEQRSFIREAVLAARQLGPRGEPFAARLDGLRRRIEAGEDPEGVNRECGELVEGLVLAGGLSRSPRRPPDLHRAGELFKVNCAPCHGPKGDGKTEIAQTMNPRPSSFLGAEAMDALTPYKAFNTVSFGVEGTAMPSFSTLEEEDRWALSFYLFTLRQAACLEKPRRATLEELATSTDPQLALRFGPLALPCLRQRPPEVDEERSLLAARKGIEDALHLASEGKHAAAREAVLDAYLTGLEPVEPLLRARDGKLVRELEESFGKLRLAAENQSPHLSDEGRKLLALIDRARRTGAGQGDFWVVFWEAFIILLREGFEATVVIAALLAVLKKMSVHRAQASYVHLGWVLALLSGGLVFALGRSALAAADREWMEAVVGLLAVGMLLYAALWLNARANVRKLMGELRLRTQGAIGRGSLLGLFGISFTAVLRETVETAVFLQGLAVDSGSGTLYGALAGAAALLAMVVAVNRVGYRLPMKILFNASTVVLVATAAVMLGKALHAFQEVGALPLAPVRMVRLEALGLYPDAVSLLPQALLAIAPLLWLALRRRAAEPQDGLPSPSGRGLG
ncbi:MAG: FTR1 family protein [Myxococcales bacterium]|nr:FTR1 family protein [Myxococcales bacterium]